MPCVCTDNCLPNDVALLIQTRRWIQSALRFLRRLQRRTRLHTAYTRTHSLIYLRRQFLGHSWTRWRHAYARWQHLTGLCDTIYATKLRDKVWYTWSNSSITRQSLWTTLSTHVVHRRHRRTLRSHWRCWLVLYRARQEQLQVETFRKRRVLFTVCREWRAVTVRQQRERRCVRYWQWRHWVQPRFQTWRQKVCSIACSRLRMLPWHTSFAVLFSSLLRVCIHRIYSLYICIFVWCCLIV